MTWLDNPVANMYGPHFLLLYVAVVVVVLGALWLLLRRGDPTAGQPAPPVPTEPDPYAIAYLRGGLDEVARVAVFELLQRGFLSGEQGVFDTVKDAPDERHLGGVPRIAYRWFRGKDTLSARQVFGPNGLAAELRKRLEPDLREPLERERLLASGELRRFRRWLTVGAAALVVGLGGYKLAVALTKGYSNVLFLIALLVAAPIAAVVIGRKAPALTVRGRKYLESLNLAFRQLADRRDSSREGSYLPLMVGLFGVAALAGTSYAFFADEIEALQRAASASSGFGASSCGSSCGGDCGGGCSGGCGGCGD